MNPRRALLVLTLLGAVLAAWGMPTPTLAQKVRRCTAADGSVVITDKPCAAISASERLPPRANGGGLIPGGSPGMRSQCARTLDDLSYLVATAIDLRDANRLAGLYHWVGMGGANAYRVFSRLEAMVNRPLLDIGPHGGGVDAEPSWREDDEGNLVAVYPRPRGPTGIRVLQALGREGGASSSTVFGLRRHMGCLWISF